jgi:hypothetical protein
MRKTVQAVAAVAAVVAGTIGITMGSASAHTATLSYDCFNVTAKYVDFGDGSHSATITINGTVHNVSFTGPSSTLTVPFVSHSGDPDVVVSTTFISGNNEPKTISATFSADSCAAATTTTRPPATTTTTAPPNVSPDVVVRPATPTPEAAVVVAAVAVVATPAFTG